MPEVSKSNLHPKDIDVTISEIHDGIYRIAGFVQDHGITFNQFLIDDERPSLIHTGPPHGISHKDTGTYRSTVACFKVISFDFS